MICPNCGGEASNTYCPYCGSRLGEATKSRKGARGRNAAEPRPNADPWSEPDWVQRDRNEFVGGGVVRESPLIEFLRELAGSSLILVSAVLMTLYTGACGYSCGGRALWALDVLSDPHNFDSAVSITKAGYIAIVAVCVGKIILALWLTIALWSLFSAGVAAKRKGLSHQAANGFQSFSRSAAGVYRLLTGAAVVTLLYTIVAKLTDTDGFPEIVRDIFDTVARFTAEAAGEAERGWLVGYLSNEAIVQAALCVLTFCLGMIRFSMLNKLFVVSGNMIRFGEATNYRLSVLPALTLLSGLATVANGVVYYLQLHTFTDDALIYAPVFAFGLAQIFCAVNLFRCNAGLTQSGFMNKIVDED